ncbi:MAG TPA: hypothetical protein VFY95_09635 [Sphingomicrobium sp.]
MKAVLLVAAASLAAVLVPAAPAQAEQRSRPVFVNSPGSALGGDFRCDVRGRHDGDRRRDCVVLGGNLGYLDYGDYDANRSFDPDKWNDWWHERPWRAYPRWVQQNQGCAPDRMWWSGSGWHC